MLLFVFRRREAQDPTPAQRPASGPLDQTAFTAPPKNKKNCECVCGFRYKQATPTGFGEFVRESETNREGMIRQSLGGSSCMRVAQRKEKDEVCFSRRQGAADLSVN